MNRLPEGIVVYSANMGVESQRLFVGNLPTNIKEQEVQNEFSAYGKYHPKKGDAGIRILVAITICLH